jgi:PIN domain nuclease of toxin-antitoxin system
MENPAMILVDTHVLVWAVADSKRLSRAASREIEKSRQRGGLAISAITLWELAFLVTRGRIQAYGTVEASVKLLTEGITIKPITAEIAALANQFPEDYPGDPADRVVILQPQVRDQSSPFMAQRVLQLHRLDEQIVLGIESRRRSSAT